MPVFPRDLLALVARNKTTARATGPVSSCSCFWFSLVPLVPLVLGSNRWLQHGAVTGSSPSVPVHNQCQQHLCGYWFGSLVLVRSGAGVKLKRAMVQVRGAAGSAGGLASDGPGWVHPARDGEGNASAQCIVVIRYVLNTQYCVACYSYSSVAIWP